jgi:D-lactate dehydrogenase
VVDKLYDYGIRVAVLRCAGFNNVDINACQGKLRVFRVPAYSPYAIAEHAMALLLTINRRTHKAYIRTRDFNFSLKDMCGFDLRGKTVGIIGTGKIGRVFADICHGFGMNILGYDKFPSNQENIKYVDLEELLVKSDIISLHCPLTFETYHVKNPTQIR